MSKDITNEELARMTQKEFAELHNKIDTKVGDLRVEMNQKFEAVDEKFEGVNQQFDRVFTGIDEIKDLLVTEVGQVKERVTRIEETIGIGR